MTALQKQGEKLWRFLNLRCFVHWWFTSLWLKSVNFQALQYLGVSSALVRTFHFSDKVPCSPWTHILGWVLSQLKKCSPPKVLVQSLLRKQIEKLHEVLWIWVVWWTGSIISLLSSLMGQFRFKTLILETPIQWKNVSECKNKTIL